MEDNQLAFSVENKAVTHLGRNLYSTTPPALAELVANSYDAYATKVLVDVNDEGSQIIIADNGKGLSFQEFGMKYTKIGQTKLEENPIKDLPKRKPMGKKGIGKLAAFSLGNIYSVYSKTLDQDRWINFTLNYEDMKNSSSEYKAPVEFLDDLPEELADYSTFESGFIVVCQELRKKIYESTYSYTKTQLSRRFYLNQDNFDIFFNKSKISLDTNSYYQNLDFLIYFGYTKEEIEQLFERESIQKIPYENSNDVVNYINSENIKGWIGSVEKPKQIENAKQIVVYSNGKIADEDILKSKPDARIATNYLVGEIQVDDLIEKLDDPITSSRQGLDDSISEIDNFIQNIATIRNYFITKWDEFRRSNAVDKLPERIKENQSYKSWLEELTPEQKKLNGKLLTLFANRIDEDAEIHSEEVDSMITSIASVINNVETDELAKAMREAGDMSESYTLLSKLMGKIAVKEDLSHSDIIRSRLDAIEQLDKLMSDGSKLEKAFEDHLAQNPWLINPYWNIDKNSVEGDDTLTTQLYHNIRKEDGDFERAFLDILIRVAEEKYPIIVELKKNEPTGHAKVSYSQIYDQITKYRTALKQKFTELEYVQDEDIKAVFILSEDAGVETKNRIKFSEKEIELLNSSNIEVLKYNKIIEQSRKMYKEHLSIIRSAKILPDLTTP